jgi:hypothetical protein
MISIPTSYCPRPKKIPRCPHRFHRFAKARTTISVDLSKDLSDTHRDKRIQQRIEGSSSGSNRKTTLRFANTLFEKSEEGQ